MFCNKNHPMEVCETFQNKQNNEKVEFLKSKGMCFGCLQYGHMSKSCQKRLSCKVCEQNHPTVLHMQRKEQQRTAQTGTMPSTTSAIISMATGSDTGAGKVCPGYRACQNKAGKGNKMHYNLCILGSRELGHLLHGGIGRTASRPRKENADPVENNGSRESSDHT